MMAVHMQGATVVLVLFLALLVACSIPSGVAGTTATTAGSRSFVLANNEFVKDGEAFQIKSGCIHYARVPPQYWNDRLTRLAALGLNTIETCTILCFPPHTMRSYSTCSHSHLNATTSSDVPWNFHETSQGVFDFEVRVQRVRECSARPQPGGPMFVVD